MIKYSEQQLKYIEWKKKKSTKLIACAGSGKTRCIIGRMRYMVERGMYKAKEILMITFSRNTQKEFVEKIKALKAIMLDQNNVKTIDSFAKHILNDDTDIDILSYAFRKYLETSDVKELMKNKRLLCINTIFVDEAQDLNEDQWVILEKMMDRFGCTIHLVGDPSQNIYQFRGSSDKFMTSFKAKTFHLTTNYRSHSTIVDFCDYLRPHMDLPTKSGIESKKLVKPIFYHHYGTRSMTHDLVKIIDSARKSGMDYSDIAILAPSRGRASTFNSVSGYGLSNIANLLIQQGIPFLQHYEESKEVSDTSISYTKKDGFVNLLTYMGSKGLEWDCVITCYANFGLINKMYLTKEKHLHDQYLLYVACSRAKKQLHIFGSYRFVGKNLILCKLNPWFKNVPKKLYDLDYYSMDYHNYHPKKFDPKDDFSNSIYDLIKNLSPDAKWKISQKLKLESTEVKQLYPKVTESTEHQVLSGRIIKRLFYYLHSCKFKTNLDPIPLISNIVNNKNVVICKAHKVYSWFSRHQHYTWKQYDNNIDSVDFKIREFVKKNMDRSIPLSEWTIIGESFYSEFVLKHKEEIKKEYYNWYTKRWWGTKKWSKVLRSIFYIEMVCYSISTFHYFHTATKGERFKTLLDKYDTLFHKMHTHITSLKEPLIAESDVYVEKDEVFGMIDFIDSTNAIQEIKSSEMYSLDNKLMTIMKHYLWLSDSKLKQRKNYYLSYYNFLLGEQRVFHYKISWKELKDIVKVVLN